MHFNLKYKNDCSVCSFLQIIVTSSACTKTITKSNVTLRNVMFKQLQLKVYVLIARMLVNLIIINQPIGLKVSTPDGIHICRGRMLTCSVDLPAQALVCSMKSFNGAHSCPTCLGSGDNTVGASPMHRYWPFNSS